MKKLISILLIAVMAITAITPTFAAGDDTQDGIVNYIKTIARLSAKQTIESYGLKPSADVMQSGIFTALFEGEDLTKEAEIAIEGADFNRAKHLEFYLYTPNATDTNFAVALYSDNDSTKERDYYYTEIKADFSGWEFFSFPFADFKSNGNPNGFENVKSVSIIPGHNGAKVDENAKLYFDDIVIRAVNTNRKQIDGTTKEPKSVVLLDAKSGAVGGLKPTTFDGVKCLKWAGTEDLHTPAIVPIPENIDLNDYGEMVFRIYPEKANLSYINIYLDADDPAVSTKDLYYGGFTSTWQGEWKDVSIKLRTDILGDISKSKSPVGGLDTVTQLRLDAVGGGSDFFPDTVYYIESITLRGTHEPRPEIKGEYILDEQYDSSSMTDYISLVKENHPNRSHPRLIINDEFINRVKKYKDTDGFLKLAYNNVFRLADAYVKTPPGSSLVDNGKLGATVRVNTAIKDIALNCGLAYHLTGDTVYTDRIWQEIENMTGTPQKWSSVNMLDTGVTATGFAIAYDWCYDVWTDEQKYIIRNTLMRNLFEGAMLQLRRGFGSWLSQPGNWNEVIANGVVCSALAIGDEPGYEKLMNEAINRTVHYLPIKGLYGFAPDGAYGEGGAYWNLALETFFFMTNSMKTAMGTDAELEDFSGLSKTGYFPFGIRGPMGAFNHSDSDKSMFEGGTPVYLYIGYRYDIPSLISFRVNYIDESLEATDLLWYDPTKPVEVDYRKGLPLDYMASGVEPQGSFRSGYDTNAYFIAFKGGNNGAGHDQSDIGSFVIDALGVRWIEDTGTETYYYTGNRNQYYRLRAEGNNCIQVNPKNGDLYEQTDAYNKYHTVCDYTDKASTDAASYAIFDMAPAYTDKLDSIKRGFALINNRTQFIIRDEFTAPEKSEIYSYYHTSKAFDVSVSDDGMSAMIKTPDGKKCAVNLITDMPDVKLGVMEAVHHPSSPKPGPEDAVGNDNRVFQKLFIHAQDVTEGSWSVVFTPLLADDEVIIPENLSLSEWSKYLDTPPQLTSVCVDGIPLADFSSNVGSYVFDADKVLDVSATAPDGIEVSITQAKQLGDAAYIKATDTSKGKSFVYKVKFSPNLIPARSTGAKVIGVSASHAPEPANPPEHAIDGNVNNRFAADGEPWLLCDLGEEKYIDAVSMAFYNGHKRKNVFNLEVSKDGQNFVKVFDGTSPGTTDKLYRYDFSEPVWARYVRFNGFGCIDINGNFVNTWNSIAEMVIHEIHTDFADTSSHWAKDDILFMRSYGLVNGVGDNLFSPEKSVTVAEFLTMVCRVAGFAMVPYEDEFADVSKDDWFAPYVATASKKGIIPLEMINDAKLNPNANLTRAQMCAISTLAYCATTFKEPDSFSLTDRFTDIGDDSYKPYIDKAIGLRLTNGMTDTTFEPSSDITRAQSATIMKRLFVIAYNVNR